MPPDTTTRRPEQASRSPTTRIRGAVATVAGALRRRERLLWWLVAAGLVGDVALTSHGIRQGLPEANPVLVVLATLVGPVVAMLALKGGALLVGVCCHRFLEPAHRPLVPATFAATWLGATALNTVVLLTH